MTTPRVTVPPQALEAIAFNLCSLHDFDVAFVRENERFATAVITEYARALSAAPAPEGGAAEDLREALIQADLKIRSLPGTDQSDVEFIRAALATREEAPAETGEFAEVAAFVEAMSAKATSEVRILDTVVQVQAIRSLLRAQPQAREDAQPVADEVLPVAWVIRTKDGHIRMWTMNETRAKTAAEAWGMEARQEGLSPITHPAPDALRIAVEALKTSRENMVGWFEAIDAEVRVEHEMHVSLEDDLDVIDQALAALQAEQKGGAA